MTDEPLLAYFNQYVRREGIAFKFHATLVGDHYHVEVWTGRWPGGMGKAGSLTFREFEWARFRRDVLEGHPRVAVTELRPRGKVVGSE